MPDQLHSISAAIGRLQAQVEVGRENDKVILSRLDEISGRLGCLAPMKSRIEGTEKRLDAIEPEVERVKKARWMSLGAATAIGAGGASGAVGVWAAIRGLFGGGG